MLVHATRVTRRQSVTRRANRYSTLRSKRIARSFARPTAEVFAVVKDVGKYSEFLPFCTKSVVVEERDIAVIAELTYGYNDMKERVLFDVSWEETDRLTARGGGTSFCNEIVYDWRFYPSQTSRNACLVQVDLCVNFTSSSYAWMFDAFGDKVQDRVIRSFAQRLDDLSSTKTQS